MRIGLLICCLLACFSLAGQETYTSVRALEAKVNEHYRRGEFARSLVFADSILRLSPANLNYLTLCYETCLAELKDTVRAVAYLNKIVSAHPYEADYVDQYGWVMLKQQNISAAMEYSERAYNLERESLPSLLNYAHALFLNSRKEQAMRIYDEAAQITYSHTMFAKNQLQDFVTLDIIYPQAGFKNLSDEISAKFESVSHKYQEANVQALLSDSFVNNSFPQPVLFDQYLKALEAEQTPTPLRAKNLSRYYGSLASFYFEKGEKAKADQFLHIAIGYDLVTEDYPSAARRYTFSGELSKSNRDTAIAHYQSALAFYRISGNPIDGARTKFRLILLDPATSGTMTVKDSILPVLEKYNVHEDLVDVYDYLASAAGLDDLLDSQRIYLDKAIRVVFMNSLAESLLLNVYRQRGHLAMRQNDLVTAEDYFTKSAAQISFSERNRIAQFHSKWDAGTLYYKKGEWEKAKNLLNEAVDLLFSMRKSMDAGSRQNIVDDPSSVFIILSEVCKKLQDNEGATKAIQLSRSFLQN